CEETERKVQFDIETLPLSETGLKALVDLEEEPGYTHLLKAFSDNFVQLHFYDFESLKYEAQHLGSKAIEIKKATLNASRYAFLRETAKVNKNILETVLKEETDWQLQLLMRASTSEPHKKGASLQDERYVFEEGTLTIDDPELDIHIKEPFLPDPAAIH